MAVVWEDAAPCGISIKFTDISQAFDAGIIRVMSDETYRAEISYWCHVVHRIVKCLLGEYISDL
jgi:hypothetical protein